ncbi:MAG: hypothetical protein ACRDP6_42960 [Actinoallomurus sp.]
MTDHDGERLDYRYLVAVDLAGFSKLSTRDQMAVQSVLHQVLDKAADHAQLNRQSWQRQAGGDGELAILPAETDGLRLVADFPRELAEVLTATNAERRDRPRIRVRLAIHHGTLTPGCLGPVGQAPIVISRLLDAAILRRVLVRHPGLDLALIVSASLHADVIESQLSGLDPSEFYRVRVRAKGVVYPAYIKGRASLGHRWT